MSEREKLIGALGEGVQESMDPELIRAFDVADREVPVHLKDPEKLRFKEGQIKLSGDGIFYTMQSEGTNMGKPAVFMRTHICNLRCVWCDSLLKGTLVRTSDKEWRTIEEVKVGTKIVGLEKEKGHILSNRYKYVEATTRHLVSHTEDTAIEILLENGYKIVCTHNHQIFAYRNSHTHWRWVEAKDITDKESLWGIGSPLAMQETASYISGWLKGYTEGDGGYSNERKETRRWETVTKDIHERLKKYLNILKVSYSARTRNAKSTKNLIYQLDAKFEPDGYKDDNEWKRGFIGGMYDAEGGNNDVQPVISNQNEELLLRCQKYLKLFGFKSAIKEKKNCYDLVVTSSFSKRMEFDSFFAYAKNHNRKWLWNESGLRGGKSKRKFRSSKDVIKVKEVRELKGKFEFYDIASTSGNFFANGVLVHNTPYTWNPKMEEFWVEPTDVPVEEAAQMIKDEWGAPEGTEKRLVVTGGEPLIQQATIEQVVEHLGDDWAVEIETNGTIAPSDALIEKGVQFNCSPKLENSFNSRKARVRPDVIEKFKEGNTFFKFVIMKPEEIDEVERDYIEPMGIDPQRVIMMPQGVTSEEVRENARRVYAVTNQRGYRLLGRLQTEIWGAKRGV